MERQVIIIFERKVHLTYARSYRSYRNVYTGGASHVFGHSACESASVFM